MKKNRGDYCSQREISRVTNGSGIKSTTALRTFKLLILFMFGLGLVTVVDAQKYPRDLKECEGVEEIAQFVFRQKYDWQLPRPTTGTLEDSQTYVEDGVTVEMSRFFVFRGQSAKPYEGVVCVPRKDGTLEWWNFEFQPHRIVERRVEGKLFHVTYNVLGWFQDEHYGIMTFGLSDDDGDGVFETLSLDSIRKPKIPDWLKLK